MKIRAWSHENHWFSMVFMWPSLDFHGFSISTSTSGNSSSDFRTSLRMLGYVFISPSERSRDLEGYYTGRVAARGRIKSSKVGCFAFWQILAIRRCVRPYLSACNYSHTHTPCFNKSESVTNFLFIHDVVINQSESVASGSVAAESSDPYLLNISKTLFLFTSLATEFECFFFK